MVNSHIEHVEDAIIEGGILGAKYSINALKGTLDFLQNKKTKFSLTTKFDGKLSLVCGIYPPNKKFFVATKSAFSLTPKLNFSNEDIDRNYPDNDYHVGDILKAALAALPKIEIDGIFQGDVLFHSAKDRQIKNINGESYIIFQPNVIVYGMPQKSPMAKELLASTFGVVWHTRYTLENGKFVIQPLNLKFSTDIKVGPPVWWCSPCIDKVLVAINFDDLTNRLNSISTMLSSLEFVDSFNYTLKKDLKKYRNKLIRSGNKVLAANFLEEFPKFYGKIDACQLRNLYTFQHRITEIKHEILDHMGNPTPLLAFTKNGNKYTPCQHEGFVITKESKASSMLKLVNRNVFSKNNFAHNDPK